MRNQREIEKTIEKLRKDVFSLRKAIEEQGEMLGEYKDIANKILCSIDNLLSKQPIDHKKLSSTALGIIKVWDGPPSNYLEERLVDLAGDVGFLVRELRQNS